MGRAQPGRAREIGFATVLRLGEFRALFAAQLLSLLGDRVAAVALSVLVFDRSRSPALAAATYAATYLPWLLAGPALAALGDRWSRRRIMIVSDLVRAALVAGMTIPRLPIGVLFALLVAAVSVNPAFESARAALVPSVVPGEQYVMASALSRIAGQFSVVGGFVAGGALLSLLHPRGCLALDAVSFVLSAVLVGNWVRDRPVPPAGRPGRFAGIAGGARLVFADPFLARLLVTAWVVAATGVIPEGLAVTYAHEAHRGSLAVGLLTASGPLGAVCAVLALTRYVAPAHRLRVARPLALGGFTPLLVAAVHPTFGVVLTCWTLAGIAAAYQLPANATYVQSVPDTHRARAMGLAQVGLAITQGLALLAAGLAAEAFSAPDVVAAAGALGLGILVALQWRAPVSPIAVMGESVPAPFGAVPIVPRD